MTLTKEELNAIIDWFVVAEFFGATNENDETLVEKLEREYLRLRGE